MRILEFVQMQKFMQSKKTKLNLRPKCFIWVFIDWNLKNYYLSWNQHHQICQIYKSSCETKKINLGAKMHYLGNFEKLLSYLNLASSDMLKYKVLYKTKELWIWDQKYVILLFLVWNWEKLLEFVKMQKLLRNKKALNLLPKMLYLGISGL